jgi:predicted dehydrogenase
MEEYRNMKKYRVIVAGCGGMSNTWLDYAAQREDTEIVGLVDIFEQSAIAMAERRGLQVPTFTDLAKAITTTGANLVFDVTIPESHKQIVTTALKHGCDLFGEKPMAASLEEANELVQLAKETGKSYAIMQNRRYLKLMRSFRRVIDQGVVGDIGSMHADFFIGAHFGGFRDLMDSPLILDMAIHTFDQARFLMGADPISVYCHEFNPPGSWYKGNASAICIFEMSNGSVFSYQGSWCAEGFPTSWEANWRLIGSKGTALWDGSHAPRYEVVDDSQPAGFMNSYIEHEAELAWDGCEGHWGCLDEMFASLEQGRLAETTCFDNIKSTAMVFGAIESAKLGQKVRLV